tara:strand:- start:39 stop:341 length:303 start_codon:yes stop_codon:yes gene_type:complete
MKGDAVNNKSWDVVATFSTYEEADLRRKQLLNVYDQVKVKRGVSDGEVFRVKVWNTPVIKEKLQKPKNKFKKKQNVKRVQRDDNKKIRARRKESQDFYRE